MSEIQKDNYKVISESPYNKDRKIVEKDDNVYFLGQELSNFHKQPFEIKGKNFHSSEQAFMYCKAKHFNDDNTAKKILDSNSPKESKKLGREVKNFDAKDWERVSEKYMNIVLKHKFESNENLKKLLLDTKDKNIIECSPFDKKWGAGISVDQALNGETIKGKNQLGNCLMNVRDNLLLEQKAFSNQDINIKKSQNVKDDKLIDTLNQGKEFVNQVEQTTIKNKENVNSRRREIHEILSDKDKDMLKNSYKIGLEVDNISHKEMLNLYNYSKDIANTFDNTNKSVGDLANELQTYEIINNIENEFDNQKLDTLRRSHLVSDSPKPTVQFDITNNERLNVYINHNNANLNNIDNNQLNRYINNSNIEIKNINDRSKANEIKNNDVFKKFDSQLGNQSKESEKNIERDDDESQKKKKSSIQIR